MCDRGRRGRKRRPVEKAREQEAEGTLTFFYMLKLMERNKRCHHSLCHLTNTHTHARTNVLTRSVLPLQMSLQNVSSFFLLNTRCCESEGLCHCRISALWMFSVLRDVTHCMSLPVSCRWWPQEKTAEDTIISLPTWWVFTTWNSPTQLSKKKMTVWRNGVQRSATLSVGLSYFSICADARLTIECYN